MTEKNKIKIRKIRENESYAMEDEVAIEKTVSFSLQNGTFISVTCTPTCLDELMLGKKYLAGHLMGTSVEEEKILENVYLREIFQIAKDSFENPGSLFTDTGCAHSCALVYEGKVICCMEDIGRHNALDKVIGYAVKNEIPFSNSYVFTSGRVSGDYMQKVIAAGFPMVVSRAAVTDKAVELAKEANVTLLGFIRKNTGNIYTEGKVKVK